jgi:hypothetical protein
MALRDLGSLPLLEESFDHDRTLHRRQVVLVRFKVVPELAQVLFRVPLRGRWRIVLVLIVPREGAVELTVGDATFQAARHSKRREVPNGAGPRGRRCQA